MAPQHDQRWCRCADSPVSARGPLTFIDHLDGCGFPEERCEIDSHRRLVHDACGRVLAMRFCGCGGSDRGFTLDAARGWWVHYVCGWPTKAWYESSGKPAPSKLLGLKPVTYHEYQLVPSTPKVEFERLSAAQKRSNRLAVGRWIRD